MKGGAWTAVIGIVLIVGLALGVVAWQGLQGQVSRLEDRMAQLSQQSQTVAPDRVDQLSQRTEQVSTQVDDLATRLSKLRDRISSVEQQRGNGASSSSNANTAGNNFKFAYVDMFQVLQELQDSPLVSQPLKKFRKEQQRIEQQKKKVRQRFQEGEITASERDQRLSELDAQLQQLNLKLSAPIQQNMIEVIRQIGKDRGYDLVIDNPASQYNAIVLYSQSGQVDDITSQVVERLKQRLRKQQTDSSEIQSGDGSNGDASSGGE
ncbi:MAG: OmpH family outer membrane protein [Candidatus Bipolaricaulia bacterium]